MTETHSYNEQSKETFNSSNTSGRHLDLHREVYITVWLELRSGYHFFNIAKTDKYHVI